MSKAAVSGTLGQLQLLAFTQAESAETIRAASRTLGLHSITVETGTVLEASEYLKTHASPEILLIEVTNQEAAPAQLDALADVVNPLTKVVVCGPLDSYRFYHWLMDLGIHEYLLQPFTAEQLVQAVSKGGAKKIDPHASAQPDKKWIAVMGARGGVGTTTITTHLAALFAREHQRATGIMDLDAHFGTVALAFDLEPGRGLRDAMEKPDRVDALFLERVMVKPFAPLSILSAEEPLAEVVNPQANAGEMIFSAMREKFNVVLVDLPRQMNPISRFVLAQADAVVLVAEPHLSSLRDALRIRDHVVENLKRPAPHLLLNRIGMVAKHEIPVRDFSKHYGAAPAAVIPYLADAVAATAQGELMLDHPKLNAALAPLRTLAATLGGTEAVSAEADARSSGKLAQFFKGK